MKSHQYLLWLRVKQGFRAVKTVGWPLLLIALPLVFILVLGIFEGSQDGGWRLTIIYGAIVLGVHFSRVDKRHLKSFGFSPGVVFSLEYFFLGLILGLSNLILVHDWQNLIYMTGLGIIVGLMPQRNFSSMRRLLFFPVNWIAVRCFEWRTGLRKNGWLFLLLIFAGVFFGHHSPAIPLVALFLTQLMMTGWYKDFEPMPIFSSFGTAKNILGKKVIQQIALSTAICIPLYIIFLWHFSEWWYILLVAIFLGHAVNCFAIFYKYAGYHPSRRKTQSDLAVAIFALSTYIPFLAPITLFYLVIYFFKARRNLKFIYAEC